MTQQALLPRRPQSHKLQIINNGNVVSFLISFNLCFIVVIGFMLTSDRFLHWFVIPVLFCGVALGIDLVDWFRGRLNLFDPVVILGGLGLHFFFLAPLLHVSWDHWLHFVYPPPDRLPPEWRDWLGRMALLNLAGILAYRFCRNVVFSRSNNQLDQTVWRIDGKRFVITLLLALLVTGSLQMWVYAQQGGISNYIRSFTSVDNASSEGMGWIFMISESFPMLVMFGYAFYAHKNKLARTWPILMLVLAVFFVLQMLFGGLRGSRSNTIWALFWAVGIIHLWIRPVQKRFILAGLVFLVTFMYFYGFFKDTGMDALNAFKGAEVRNQLTKQTGRSLEVAVLDDLGRSDVQAFLLYRLSLPESDYKYAWGRSYVGALSLLIPKAIWPERPASKMKEVTEAFNGNGTYVPGSFQSLMVTGLAGETMLNFGFLAVPLAFVLLGFIVGKVRRWLMMWHSSDVRLLILPLLVNLCFVILEADSDNVVFFIIKYGTVPFLVVALSSKKHTLQESSLSNETNFQLQGMELSS